MNILFIGDISGRPGRETIQKVLRDIKNKYKVDFVIANAENSAGGRGVTTSVLNELQSDGIDFFTTGEHVWDQKNFREELYSDNLPIVRPYNYEAEEELPGKGFKLVDTGKYQILIISLIGQTFMKEHVRSPFWSFDALWNNLIDTGFVSDNYDANPIIIVDFHAEATSEKISLAWYLKERVSAVLGTHTHVGTVDTRILDEKCAFVTDVGMVGPYDASLWVNFDTVTHNFKYPFKKAFEMEMAGSRIFNSVLMEFDGNIPKSITRIDKII